MDKLCTFLCEQSLYSKGLTPPCKETLSNMKGLSLSKEILQMYNLPSEDFRNAHKNLEDYFAARKLSSKKSPTSTFSSIAGGVPHAGAGSTNESSCRLILFYTGTSKDVEGYEGDTQETKLTTMIEISSQLWGTATLNSRKDLIHLIALTITMSNFTYTEIACNNYSHTPKIAELILDLHHCMADNMDLEVRRQTRSESRTKCSGIISLVGKYAENNDLFE